jgi:hypothetical protein
MSLFVCDQCNAVANTATDGYWEQLIAFAQEGTPRSERKFKCSECRTGKWHGRFPKDEWDGQTPMKNRGKSGPAVPMRRD